MHVSWIARSWRSRDVQIPAFARMTKGREREGARPRTRPLLACLRTLLYVRVVVHADVAHVDKLLVFLV